MRLGCTFVLVGIPCLVAGQTLTLARVTGETVNVRLGPGVDSPRVGEVSKDSHAVICEKLGSWYRIYLPQEFHVYVNGKDLTVAAREGTCLRETTVHLAPDRHYQSVGKLARDTKVRLVKQYGVWWAIEPPLSLTGYMKEDFLSAVRAISTEEAERILGRPVIALPAAPMPGPSGDAAGSKGGTVAKEPSPPAVPSPAVAGSAPETARERPAAGPVATEDARGVNLTVATFTDGMRKAYAAFMEAKKGPAEQWNFAEVRNLCENISGSSQNPEEKEYVRRILDETTFLERMQGLLFPKRPEPIPPPEADTGDRKPKPPLAVGWVRGQGRYIGRAGTHVLEKGENVLYYLVGEDVVLDSCVNRLVSIDGGTIEDLPPEFGCKRIRVKSVKVLAPNP
jgi:hypothetical protein